MICFLPRIRGPSFKLLLSSHRAEPNGLSLTEWTLYVPSHTIEFLISSARKDVMSSDGSKKN